MFDPLPRVIVARTHDVLAELLRERIVSGALPPGAMLPGERELVTQTGLSRGSVREALRTLEAEGLLRTRLGRYGGMEVLPGNADAIGRLVDLFIKGRRIPFSSLLQARQAIEPTLAAVAAVNRTDEHLAAIERVGDALEDGLRRRHPDMTRLNVEWHLAVADASGNELLAAMLHSMAPACIRAGALEEFGSPELRDGVSRAHRGITAALRGRDPDAARRRMQRHLGAYEYQLARKAPTAVALDPI